ncbi:threonine dehydratase [Loigolactobacillus backii]|uniref:threonine ammonia-lyase IlvA n=1 Tax=Loigolactobacillus backii TaxID=375175 RepID=UPI0007F0CC13|nr:threonine ammonia-lyase IlvA [Loigolactobacillus backii]ANK60841.1 threonine dehydratase [Loigolactobacillus backii]ANK65793.1 threonine dehydratase [Loigolactobacillus backii]ANK68270.1 threonine dehydratase [Loigolactobacillus backii]OLF70055.1 threonine dehydratase [Loigolactobacillus backii]PIO86522.1 threonine dehydratase [Loigolactobacillus backii]
MDLKTKTDQALLTKEDVEKANEVLAPIIRHTPLQYDVYLSQKYHCQVYLKREDLQAVRSFKIRGAYYAIHATPAAEREKGVVYASAGNHAQGVAWTCHNMKVPATIFMPTTTPQQKVSQVAFFGGDDVTIKLVGDTFDASAEAAEKFCQEKQQTFIAPFNDKRTMAGQGTLAVEVLADAEQQNVNVDYFLAAVGGGGLLSGTAAYIKAVSPRTRVVGVEPAGAASMTKALEVGHPVTLNELEKFVDGAAVRTVGELTYANVKAYVDDMLAVPEGQVCSTILDLYSKEAIVAEPAGALSVSALEQYQDEVRGKTVVCVISGGNNDINRMQEIEERSLIFEGYQHYFVVDFPQRPGALREFVNEILGPDDDITKFEYTKKVNRGKGPVLIGVRLGDKTTLPDLLDRLTMFDPHYINLKDNQMLYTMLV